MRACPQENTNPNRTTAARPHPHNQRAISHALRGLNAKITANIVGQTNKIEFFDDGKHDDQLANDGIYGATTEKLSAGNFYVEAKALVNNQTLTTIAQINQGEPLIPAKTGTKRRGK